MSRLGVGGSYSIGDVPLPVGLLQQVAGHDARRQLLLDALVPNEIGATDPDWSPR